MKNFFRNLFSLWGRYFLFAFLAVTGVFSQYGTIELVRTDWVIFEITATIGIAGIVLNFLYHVIGAIVTNIKKPKN